MTKALEIYPDVVFKPGKITFKDIPVCAYKKTVAQEKKLFSKEDFATIYHDMCVCRTFETILNQIKREGNYKGVEYNHAGPAHLSMGQEAAAVGQAFVLDVEDHIFGSHRSHSEILAKGLSAIRQLDDERLLELMKNFFDGATLAAVEKDFDGDVKTLARRFLVYGAYAEIFARVTGFNKGWGGSMHAFFIPFGVFPNNAIVGGSGSVAPGGALFKRVNRKPGIVVANIGDASFGCGPVWEGISFAAMDQYRKLWDKELGGGLPLLVNCMNNQYGMGGQTCGETMGYEMLARIGAGVNPEQMHSERVNGYDPLAVIDAVKRKKKILLDGRGPVLLDTVTYRLGGHSPSDASSYRTQDEIDRWTEADAIDAFAAKITKNDIIDPDELEQMRNDIEESVFDMFKLAIDPEISPYETMDSLFIETVTFSNTKVESFDESREPECLEKLEDNDQYKRIQKKERFAFKDGKPVPSMKQYNFRDAVFEAMMHRFMIDPTMVAFGEENRDWGGAFACYRGMTEALPYHRLFNSPISEAGIVGAAVGYALSGGRVVAELMYCDFLGRAGDETFNQLSKWQAMSGGILKMPVVLRISVGFKYGAQHSQEWSAILNHIPGLKVVYPVTPYDAKGLLNTALAGTDPVVFLESQTLYGRGEEFHEDGVPEDYYEIEIGDPDVKRTGSDLTIVTFGPTLYKAVEVADTLEKDFGLSAEIIDLRSVNPLNYDKLVESVKKTGKVVLASEAVERGNVMHNVAANLTQLAFDYLDAPPVVVGARNWVSPAAELEEKYFPQPSWLIDAIHERIIPLEGYTPKTNKTLGELARTNRLGV
jgi:2-oxoisovalerate dehydrogenase E1 component